MSTIAPSPTQTRPSRAGYQLRRIILPEDESCLCRDVANECHCIVRTGGDKVTGVVEAVGTVSEDETVEVRLEGYIRTWIPHKFNNLHFPEICEVRFLKAIDVVSPSSPQALAEDNDGGCGRHELRFNFRIPAKLISTTTAEPLIHELYPTMRAGAAYWDALNRCFMQPLICYMLIASIRGSRFQKAQVHCSREIIVIPTAWAEPPLYLESPNGVYRLQSTGEARKHIFGHIWYEIQLEAMQPSPLNTLSTTPRMATRLPIKVRLKNRYGSFRESQRYSWGLTVRTTLQKHASYSVKEMGPDLTISKEKVPHDIGLRTAAVVSETRRFTGLTWRTDRMSNQFIAVTTEPAVRPPLVTSLDVPVSALRSLQPSFHSPTAELRYSIALDVSVSGMHGTRAMVEVPVQVLRNPVPAHSDGVVLPETDGFGWEMITDAPDGVGHELPGYSIC